MYKKIIIGAAAAAAVVGAGGTALAVTGSDATSGTASLASSTSSGSASSSADKPGKAKHRKAGVLLRRLEHGTVVTKGKDGAVTHDLIRGDVTAVSATSVTVKAADGTSEAFTVTKDTSVRVRTDGKGAASSITHVATGDRVFVTGTGSTTKTAKRVVDVKK